MMRRPKDLAPSPIPPSHPLQSEPFRLASALVDANASGEFRPWQFQSAILEMEARQEGRLSPIDRYRDRIPNSELKAILGLPDGFSRLLGRWESYGKQELFIPGVADLTAQECRAYELEMAGLTMTQIAAAMSNGKKVVKPETAEHYVDSAKQKLYPMFGVEYIAKAS
jgi:hypothetical protein